MKDKFEFKIGDVVIVNLNNRVEAAIVNNPRSTVPDKFEDWVNGLYRGIIVNKFEEFYTIYVFGKQKLVLSRIRFLTQLKPN